MVSQTDAIITTPARNSVNRGKRTTPWVIHANGRDINELFACGIRSEGILRSYFETARPFLRKRSISVNGHGILPTISRKNNRPHLAIDPAGRAL
jgi:hypothetical protein